jgi:hypothetical protein
VDDNRYGDFRDNLYPKPICVPIARMDNRARPETMTTERPKCESCDAQVLPGFIACRNCINEYAEKMVEHDKARRLIEATTTEEAPDGSEAR